MWKKIKPYIYSVVIALLVGGATMQRMTEVPYSVVEVIQGLIIIFVITRTAFNSAAVKAFFARRMKK